MVGVSLSSERAWTREPPTTEGYFSFRHEVVHWDPSDDRLEQVLVIRTVGSTQMMRPARDTTFTHGLIRCLLLEIDIWYRLYN